MSEDVLQAFVQWVRKPGKKGTPEILRAHIRSLPQTSPGKQRRRVFQTSGHVHDLAKIADEVNRVYFDGMITSKVTWGRDTSRKRVRVRRVGSYQRDVDTIVIHPILDDRRVPEKVVAFTLFHEMLHAQQPATQKRHHDKAFRQAEKTHPHYDEVETWMKKHTRLINGGGGRKLS